MKTLVSVLLFSFASYATAVEHIDAINLELRDDCTLQQYLEIIEDFNKWGEDYNYRTEIAVPIQSSDLVTMFWMGRSPSAQSYGKAWDDWRDAQGDASSEPAKLQARFNECAKPNSVRRGFDLY